MVANRRDAADGPTIGDGEQALLPRINGPADLKAVRRSDLGRLAQEIRRFLVEHVSRTGGHLGSNLGAVELTIALHRVFESPRDLIVFDTGHQAYVHKILTGRAGRFGELRQSGGLSGYPDRAESDYDHVENSHASTALSYADGLAKAVALRGERRHVVAVVGDGALTGGMCWEALNNIGAARDRPVIILLNDNGRSYAPTRGGVAAHLRSLVQGGRGRGTMPTAFLEQLGLHYIGPIAGRDIGGLERALNRAKRSTRPVVVHAVTRKGRGYRFAEDDPADCLHSPAAFDPVTGRPRHAEGVRWTGVFADELLRLADDRPDIVAVTAAMAGPTGLARLQERYPHRVFDVGIAEQHATTSAAGLAMGGMHPVVAIYATFLNRAFDQLLLDVALHRMPVTFVADRAGITGPDGPSHYGIWDLAIFSVVPGMRIAAPRDAATLRAELAEAVSVHDGPTLVRFPTGQAADDLPAVERHRDVDVLRRARTRDVLLVTVGPFAHLGMDAAERVAGRGVGVTVVDPRWPIPVPAAIVELAGLHRAVFTVEDGTVAGGVGAAVARRLRDAGVEIPVHTLGVRPGWHRHGSRTELLARLGFTPDAVAETILARLRSPGPELVDLDARPAP